MDQYGQVIEVLASKKRDSALRSVPLMVSGVIGLTGDRVLACEHPHLQGSATLADAPASPRLVAVRPGHEFTVSQVSMDRTVDGSIERS